MKKRVLAVVVDGREIGSLGRSTKRVSTDVEPGRHVVEVISFGGWKTKTTVDVGAGETVLHVAFPGFTGLIARSFTGRRPDPSQDTLMQLVNRSEAGGGPDVEDRTAASFEPGPSALVLAAHISPLLLIFGGIAVVQWIDRPAGLVLFGLGIAASAYSGYLRLFRNRRS